MIQEHHLSVRRTARYYQLGEATEAVREVWIVCHGYGQLAASFIKRFEPLADPTRLIAAPEGLSRFYLEMVHGPDARIGASWMTREDRLHEIDDYVAYLDAVRADILAQIRAGARVVALGFSQGTATASRWAVRANSAVDRLVLWAGPLPDDVEPAAARERLNALDLTLVAGDHDDMVTPARLAEQRTALNAAGVRYRLVTFKGGHVIAPEPLRGLLA